MQPLAALRHDLQLIRRAAGMVAADRRGLSLWHARTVGTSLMTRWTSAGLCRRAETAKTAALGLCERSASLRRQTAEGRVMLVHHDPAVSSRR